MPRPRVRPADRRRAAKACITCKAFKKRCDANLPCGLCLRKGRAESCVYPDADEQSTRIASRRPRIAPRPPRGRERLVPDALTLASRFRERGVESDTSVFETTRESSPQCTQRPTMLLSSRGEQVYIGNVAALSFLQFLQKTLKRYIGPSAFTERRRAETMLEAEVENGSACNFRDNLNTDQKYDLVRCFMRVSNGVLDLFPEDDINRLLELENVYISEQLNTHPLRDEYTCVYLMIAIGAQCRGGSQEEIQLAEKYFARAQQMAFVDMLQDPSLCMIKIFLMMAFYMLGACRRNTAFMYLGIASKAATTLGLHTPPQHARSSTEGCAVRRRIWMSLRVLDLLSSAILARPSSTPTIQGDGYETDGAGDNGRNQRNLALKATYESSSIIDAIVQNCAQSSSLDIKSAENFLQMLREWSQALPEVLRRSPSSQSENQTRLIPDSREMTIGNIHVSCTYYFGIILVTRQFLISRVMSHLRGRKSHAPEDAAVEEKTSQFSNGCVTSAAFMAELCSEAAKNNVIFDNMCLLKAWLFSAGLVLGFSLLVEDEDWPNARDAFAHTRETLQKLARLSPQAQQYYEILTRFSSAIDLYRQQLLARQKPNANPYVEQIMAFEEGAVSSYQSGRQSHNLTPGLLRTPEPSIGYDEDLGVLETGNLGYELEVPPFATQGDDIGLQWMWDNYAMQVPNFAIN